MRLGFVSDFYYPSIGGTQMLCKGIAEWFRDQGHDIEVITSADKNREDMNYPVHEIKGTNFINRPYNLEGYNDILSEQKYDALFVLADLFSPSILSLDSEIVRKTILILNLDENVYRWIHEGKIKDLNERIEAIKKYSHIVSFCQGAPVNKFLDENDIKYHFIPNFSRDVIYGEKERKITKDKLGITKKIIFNHGNYEIRKNQHTLMKAFLESGLSSEYDLVLLGSPRTSDDKAYFNICLDLKIKYDKTNSIKMFKGTNNQALINQMLSISDIYFLPSLAEGLPLVLLEAMSAGLPWISTPVGGVPKVLGSLSSGKVMKDINFQVVDFLESIREVENKNSRKDWEKYFTIERAGKQYAELLELK